MAIAQETANGVTLDLYKYSTSYTSVSENGSQVASGTVVDIGGRVFIATVRHGIPADVRQIGLVGKAPTFGDRSRWILGSVKHDYLDIGAIEISSAALDELNLKALPLNRIINIGPGEPAFKSRVVGYPWDFRAEHFPQKGVLGFKALSYGCEVRHVSAWDKLRIADLDPYSSIVAYYEQEDNIDWSTDPVISSTAPHPSGMSGGGYWQRDAPLSDKELWHPDGYFLFGIQTGWEPKVSHLCAIQIIHWLKLVADAYAETASVIKARFPEVDLE